MDRSPGSFTEEIVGEFCASYFYKRENPATDSLLMTTLVSGFLIDVFETTLCRILYGLGYTLPINITKFESNMNIVRCGNFK